MSETILSAHGLSCGYRDRRVLSGIDLDLDAGEITSLLGPNGSGKSTLLRTLVGLLKPVQGEVILSGKPLSLLRPSDIARSVAYVAQDERIEFAFTAEEIVRMGRSPFAEGYFDSSKDRELAEEAMVESDCIEFRNRFITELSGGERQRVFIARALAQHPKLLLLDEPSAHFDVRHVLALATLLEKVRAKGIAVFTAIHDLNFAQQLQGKAVLLYQGKVQAQGLAADVLASEALDDAYEVKFRRIKSGETFVIVPELLK